MERFLSILAPLARFLGNFRLWVLGIFAPLLWTGVTFVDTRWLYLWRSHYILVRLDQNNEWDFMPVRRDEGKEYIRMYYKSLTATQPWTMELTERGRIEFKDVIS